MPSISGLDTLVFTAGIGENAAPVRQSICDQLAWMGILLDAKANDENATQISTAHSKIKVLVVPTNEEVVVANACRLFSDTRGQRKLT